MVELTSLWLPILVSAAAIFFLSFLMWMVLPHHHKDHGALKDEDGLMSALRAQGVKPGLYAFPHCAGSAQMKDPEWMKKRDAGPSGFLNVCPARAWNLGAALGKWFILLIVICTTVAYAGTIALPAGAAYMTVFRLTGTCLLLAFCSNIISDCIWKSHPARPVLMHVFDGLVYALVAGGIFGWLWPEASLAL
ncbi:MAG: hypothetical protein O3A20_10170 [Planctomycetota bacterium]|nr:hypothetical protein [Planctomycetota bacterium]